MFNMRIGFGKDIHCLKEGIELIIGGVKIPSKIGSYSYSDGDALTHAIIDSLLGALALNDIGEHFKDNDIKNYKRSSIEMLKEVKKMIDYSNRRLLEEGYHPYYLYKQKNTPLGLENVGYTQKGHVCIFNVDSMEETCSVLACGANAISKRVFSLENRIERCCNVKFIEDYISRIDEMIERKQELFK